MTLSQEQRDWLALTLVHGVGSAYFVRLLARFRTPSEVLRASEAALADVVGPKLARTIRSYRESIDIETQERLLDYWKAHLITMDDAAYPPRLAEIYDPPLALFCRGELLEEDERCVAIVGTRRPSPYGLRMAEELAAELARQQVTVVSGLATGIDAAAHRGALRAGGRTLAVLGNGVDQIYPRENRELMEAIIRRGCVLSEYPMGVKPGRGHFPQRNRIISGLTLGVVIVEAPERSGSLITARHAAEQGREVFAVPGQVGQLNSAGPHGLLREGAKLVERAEDILVELALPETALAQAPAPPQRAPVSTPAPAPPRRPAPAPQPQSPPPRPASPPPPPISVTPEEQQVLEVLSPDGSFVDEIALACRIPVSQALSALTLLELKGLVRQYSGKRFAPA